MSRHKRLFLGLLATALALTGLWIVSDRPGLAAEYFALTDAWQGAPVFRQTRPPRVERADELERVFHSTEVFSIRWKGWMWVEEAASHEFELVTDEAAYLEIGERLVADAGGLFGPSRPSGSVDLPRGYAPVEIGMAHSEGPAFLQILTAPTGDTLTELDAGLLWSRAAAGPLSRLGRRSLSRLSRLERKMLGGLLLLAGLLLLRRGLPLLRRGLPLLRRAVTGWRLTASATNVAERLRWRLGERSLRRGAALVLLAILGVVTYRFMLRLAGSPLGFDDVRYLDTAFRTGAHGWMVDRYVHVYLMKLWQGLFPSDVFIAARHYWATLGTASALSLALAAFALGPRLQVGTLAVGLWLMLSQSIVYWTAGAMWSDYTLMALVTAAVAVVLHRQARNVAPRWEWHALILGALTLGAARSKATGAVLLFLALTFLWENGRIDLRRCARKTGFWIAGLAAAQVLVMAIDARILGDAFYSMRSYTHQAAGRVHLEVAEPETLKYGWMDQVWPRLEKGELAVFEYFPLGLLVAGALLAAAATRQKPERIVVHLLPFAYLGALLLLQVRGTYGALPRHLFPLVPTAALLGATLFHYAGLDRLGRREMASWRFLVPLFLTLLLTFGLVVPTVNGEYSANDLVPLAAGPEDGWSSPHVFGRLAVIPAGLALVTLVAPFVVLRRRGRVLLLLSAALLLFANETVDTFRLHATRRPAQRSDMILYPWTAFAEEVRGNETVVVSPYLIRGSQRFFGPQRTARRVAQLYFRDGRIRVWVLDGVGADIDVAFGTAADIERWEKAVPGLGATAVHEPLGRMILVRPREAASGGAR